MSITLALLVVWLLLSILAVPLLCSAPRERQTVCMVCGRVIDGPGICSICSQSVYEVDQVVQVRHVINPEDLRD